jgi:hypothetical protein
MITFSYGREDGTSASISALDGEWLTGPQVLDWLFEHVVGPYTDTDGQERRQVPVSFFFNHDLALICKDFDQTMQLVYKATARDRDYGVLCWTHHLPDEPPCPKLHRDDQTACQQMMTTEGEGDILAWDPTTCYAIATTPKRRFYVEHRPAGDRFDGNRRLDVHDIGTAFTGGLEAVLKAWNPELPPGHRDAIAWGKQARKTGFEGATMAQVEAYSEAECVALAKTGRLLINAVRDAGKIVIEPAQLFGSGSLAAAAYKTYGAPIRKETAVSELQVSDALTVEQLADMTYFGGLIEPPVLGLLDQPVTEVDIASAYPSQMIHLPCMREEHGMWIRKRHAKIRDIPAGMLGHVKVRWSVLGHGTQMPPFVVRRKDGRVAQPLTGVAWVTLTEYQTALAQFGHGMITALDAVYWQQTCLCGNPLAFLSDLYDARRELKKQMDEWEPDSDEWGELNCRQLAVKLVINSAYGKLAQRRPLGRYTNLHWSAHITGATRAQLRRECWEREAQGGTVVYVHTDSVKSIGGAPVDGGHTLGAWELSPKAINKFIIAQPGLAISIESGKGATRGCGSKEFQTAVETWLETADLTQHPLKWPNIEVKRKVMLSRKIAMIRGTPKLAGTFVEADLSISFESAKRDIQNARPLANNPQAWSVPPIEWVYDQAEWDDIRQHQTWLDKYLAEHDNDPEVVG